MATLLKNRNTPVASYAYSKENIPFPEKSTEKIKPPVTNLEFNDSSSLFAEKELTQEEKAIEFMSTYKKFERVIVCNFYTGGGKYTNGILNSIYRGFNPLNP